MQSPTWLKAISLIGSLLIVCAVASAEEKTYGDVEAFIVKISDGDTVKVDVPEWPPIVGEDILVRVYGVDTPEKTDPRPDVSAMAFRAKAATMKFVGKLPAKATLKNLRRDKYFRLLADVWVDNGSVGDMLVRRKLAHTYGGATKDQDWKDLLKAQKNMDDLVIIPPQDAEVDTAIKNDSGR